MLNDTHTQKKHKTFIKTPPQSRQIRWRNKSYNRVFTTYFFYLLRFWVIFVLIVVLRTLTNTPSLWLRNSICLWLRNQIYIIFHLICMSKWKMTTYGDYASCVSHLLFLCISENMVKGTKKIFLYYDILRTIVYMHS